MTEKRRYTHIESLGNKISKMLREGRTQRELPHSLDLRIKKRVVFRKAFSTRRTSIAPFL